MRNKISRLIASGILGGAAADTTAPTVVITSAASGLVAGAFTCTFTFSEAVTGFVVGDITVGNGTAGNFAGSGAVYTADITPTATGTVTVDVAAGVCVDGAGNENEAATQFSIVYVAATFFAWGFDGVYKDGGTTLAANGETVQQWNNQAGTPHAAQATEGLRPTYIAASAINSKPALRWSNHVLDVASLFDAGYNTALTIFTVGYNSASDIMCLVTNGTAGFEYLQRRYAGNLTESYYTNNLSDNQIDYAIANANQNAVEVFAYDGSDKYVAYNGIEITEAATGNLALVADMQIGRYGLGSQPWIGDIGAVVVVKAALSLANKKLIANALNTKFGEIYRPSQIVCDGNSLTQGAGSTGGNTYPAQLAVLLPKATVTNLGVSGQTTTQMEADAAAQVDVLQKTIYLGQNVVCAWEISNEIIGQAVAAATAYNNFVTYCQNRQAAGWKVVALTVLPRTDTDQTAFNADRATVNASIRANWATFADALADVAADSRIGDDGDQNDATYYADTTHLNNTGYGIVAGIVNTALTGIGA